MQKGRRILAVMLSVICILSMTACGKQEEEEATVVYEFGKQDITYGEFYI